ILLSFLAGSMFPLDILPRPIYILLSLLPFPYLIYGPLKIYLGQQNIFQIFLTLGVGFVWIFILGLFANVMWKKGLSLYGAEGK
ncbi:MAG TPA: ABC-2 family transporter protein, partial [Candidatus Saccharimonadales bacterium]|nr:ABC-2 family transporter protein [Candidatus Saccharimonadales bacterium]